MVRMTAELITGAGAFVNAVSDRELDLRSLRIPSIENLGATLNQFDTINLTENEIRHIGNFPLLPRLRCLILADNKITSVDQTLGTCLPALDTLVLTNNSVTSTEVLDALASSHTLVHLSLLNNPVCMLPDYRLHAISRLPKLRVLDFQRVTAAERTAALKLAAASGPQKAHLVVPKQKHTSQELQMDESSAVSSPTTTSVQKITQKPILRAAGLSEAEKKRIMTAIKSAKSMEEIQRLEEMLSHGRVPENVDAEVAAEVEEQ